MNDLDKPGDVQNTSGEELSFYASIDSRARIHRDAFVGVLSKSGFYNAIDALLAFWTQLADLYAETPDLKEIQPLVTRGKADVEASVFLMDNGLYAHSLDTCRDLMELEFLFRHFFHHRDSVVDWLDCSSERRKNKYSPNSLRQAEAKRLGVDVSKLTDTGDYRGHSQSLHISLKSMMPRECRTEFSESLLPETIVMFEVLQHGQKTAWQVWRFAKQYVEDIEALVDTSSFERSENMRQGIKYTLGKLGFPTDHLKP